MQSEITYKMDKNDLIEALMNLREQEIEERILNKYYNSFVGVATVAEMHRVSQNTVLNYIKDGLLNPEPRKSEGARYLFRMSEALRIDFPELRKKLKRHA